jgi:peptide/nickel transport system substrate-binding protein
VNITVVQDNEVLVLKAIQGEFDIFGQNSALADFPVYQENKEKGGYEVYNWIVTDANQMGIQFNLTIEDPVKRELFRDRRFRIAFSHAIDRDEINQTFYKGLGVASQPTVEAGPPYYGENLFKIYLEHDPDQANAILDELGLDERDGDGYRLRSDGERLRMQIYAMPSGLTAEIADLYTGYWGDIGIETVARAGSWDSFGGIYNTNDFDLIMFPFGLAGRPMNPLIRGEVVPVGTWFTPGREWAAWLNTDGAEGMEPPDELKQIAALRERAISSADEAERIAITMEIFSLLEEGLYMIGAVRPPRQDYYGIANANLGNIPDPIIAEHIHEVPAQFYFKS